MTARLLEGKPLARQIEDEVKEGVRLLKARGIIPCLNVILVGDDPASSTYVGSKERACARVGVASKTLRMPPNAPQEQVIEVLARLNEDPLVHGVLVQLPLPPGIDPEAVVNAINPAKDVDGLAPANLGKLLLGCPYTVPCTPAGVLALLEHFGVDIEGASAVIIGRSNIVGKPLAALLMQKARHRNCTVTVCHSGTRDIGEFTRRADLVVTAMGSPGYLKASMVKTGAVVVDVGINRVTDPSAERGYALVGDADFAGLADKVSWITPVPGGVGPLTVAMLLKNTLQTARYLACTG